MLFTLYFIRDLFFLILHASPLMGFFALIIIILGQRIGRREGWTRFDALYYSFITATTVGYGDFRPKSPRSKIHAVSIAFCGLIMTGIMVTLAVEAASTAFRESGVYQKIKNQEDDPETKLGRSQENEPSQNKNSDFAVVGYLPEYRIGKWSPEQLGPVTDLIYFGAKLSPEGQLVEPKLTVTAQGNLNIVRHSLNRRVLLCVGGGGRSQGFDAMTANQEQRSSFLRDLLAYCLDNGYDGVDYDWEFPQGNQEQDAYADLLVETKQAFAPLGLLVTVAQAPSQNLRPRAYRAVDRVHLMSYNHAFPQATLPKSKQDIARLEKQGCPVHKITLGVPFYGRNKESKTRTYAALVEEDEPSSRLDEIDGFAMNSYSTVKQKTEYAQQKKLAGVMIWELGQDSQHAGYSLVEAISEALEEN